MSICCTLPIVRNQNSRRWLQPAFTPSEIPTAHHPAEIVLEPDLVAKWQGIISNGVNSQPEGPAYRRALNLAWYRAGRCGYGFGGESIETPFAPCYF